MTAPIEQRLIAILNGHDYALRLKPKDHPEPESWGHYLIAPVPGYIEINGPWAVRHVEWVEVNPVVTTSRGRLVPPLVDDCTGLLRQQLTQAGLSFIVTDDGYIRIFLR